MSNHVQTLARILSEDLRREQFLLADQSSDTRKRALRRILSERLSVRDPHDADHILEMVKKQFPSRVHERDLELERYKKQLTVLSEENRMLQSKLAVIPQDQTSLDFLQDVITRLLKSYSDQDFIQHEEDFAARMSDSLGKIILFVKQLGESYVKILHLFGIPVSESDLLQVIKARLSEQVDPGSEHLEEYLAKLKQRMFSLLEVQQETIIAGVHKMLDELDPKKLGRVKDTTNVNIGPLSLSHRRDKWTVFEKAFSTIRKTPRNKLYRTYFEEHFKQAILEREKDVKTKEEK